MSLLVLVLVLLVIIFVIVIILSRQQCRLHRGFLVCNLGRALRKRELLLKVDALVYFFFLCGLKFGIIADLLVRILIHLLQRVTLDLFLDVLGELRGVPVGVLLLQKLHILGDVTAEDVLLMRLSVKFLGFAVVARETLFAVRNQQAPINGALERAKYLGACRCACEAYIKHASERALVALLLDLEHLAVDLLLSSVILVETNLLQKAARHKQASAVARGVIGETNFNVILRELVRVRSADAHVASDL
mmetsp:Transcript_23024/g.53232  ORF Transcript_23024/g.53232 Transcript_23024/m.53232 type:complete len:248 (+) Transcript_23024:198-941(+)